MKITALLTVVAWIACLGTASAAAVDSDNAKCRSTNAKNSSKLASTISKAFDGCIKAGVKALSGTCVTTAGADTKGKVPGAKQKTLDGILSSCDDTATAVALAEHQLCGTPVGGAAITSFTAVGPCLNNLVDQNVARWRNAILNPVYSGAAGDVGKCINAIAKAGTKYLSTIQKEQSKAVNAADKIGGDSNYVNPGDPAGKIAAAKIKLSDGIHKACDVLTSGQWASVRSCDDDVDGVVRCVGDKTQALAEGLIASAYDQPGSCPSQVQVAIHHAASGSVLGQGDLGATELDVGWTGLGHNSDVIDDFVGRVNISCGVPPDDCTSCSATASCAEGNCRCSNSITTLCTQPFGEDGVGVEECGANDCQAYFGPPLPLSASGTPTCVVNEIKSELINTANIATGESDTAIDNRAIVYGGITQDQPCPNCNGDATANDGVRNGTCAGGARNGLTCDENGSSETFGATSYDCPPTALSNISGSGLKINLDLTDDAIALPFALPCDPPIGFLNCACSTCTGDNALGCNHNADCTGFGTCRTDGLHGGAPRQPNGCSDGTCEVLSGEEGQCTGQNELFCDGFVKSNGEGILTCASNADCGTYGIPVAEAGNCTLGIIRKCFLNPIEADGIPGSEGAVLVSNFCSAPTSSGSVNAAAGTPGPSRLALDFEFYGKCANGDAWGPGGANCQ